MKRGLRVLALVTDGFGGHGGIAQYNRDFVAGLAAADSVDSICILPRSGEPAAVPESFHGKVTQLTSAPSRWSYSLRAIFQGLRTRPDVVFCGHLYMAPLAWVIGWLIGKPFWLQLHGIEVWQEPLSRSPFKRAAAEAADIVTAVSRYTRRWFLAGTRIAPEKVLVLPNTFSAPVPGHLTKEALKQRYGLAGRKVILTVARIDRADRYKGHDKVIAALPEVLRAEPSAVYVVVGDGDDRRRLEQLVAQQSLTDRVRWAGRVDAQILHDYYRLADTFAMPSSKEGFGIVFLEAASFGLPVIGGNADGSVDALGDGDIGRIIDLQSPGALVAALVDGLSGRLDGASDVGRFSRVNFNNLLGRILQARVNP